MTFQKGVSGNPNGRRKGTESPVTRAKNIILNVFLDNQVEFKKRLQQEAKKDPLAFYMRFVLPFMPKPKEESSEESKNDSSITVVLGSDEY